MTTDIFNMMTSMQDFEIKSKINNKVSEVLDEVDLHQVVQDPMFQKMLAAAMAAKAAGVTFNGTV